jgi:hypothetical protein
MVSTNESGQSGRSRAVMVLRPSAASTDSLTGSTSVPARANTKALASIRARSTS